MVKRFFILVLIFLTSGMSYGFTSEKSRLNSNGIQDEKIKVTLTMDLYESFYHIEHDTDYKISYAVIEIAYIRDAVKYSELKQVSVTNDKFGRDKNWIAIKLHQVKVLTKNVYYTYSVYGENIIGSLDDVIRLNIVEIETVDIKTVNTNLKTGVGSVNSHKYYELYFNFEKQHDTINFLTANYVFVKNTWWKFWEPEQRENMTKTFYSFVSQTIQGWVYVQNLSIYVTSSTSIKTLEKDTSGKSNYVLRIAPATDDILPTYYSYTIENVAIIQIGYVHEGEFIIDDVINDPVTPVDDYGFISSFINSFVSFINGLMNLSIPNWVYIVLYVVLGLIFLTIILPVLKFVFLIIKNVGKLFKWLFIPKKKNKRKKIFKGGYDI